MGLRLTVVSDQAPDLGDLASVVLDKQGGSIGRAHDNDWVLPDPKRYISSHHARISFRNGGYFVEDTSTNGVFLNDDNEPLGRLGAQPLRAGDQLRIGPYVIAVRDQDASADASQVTPIAFGATSTDIDPDADIASDLSIEHLLSNDPDISAARRAFDPWGNPVNDSAVRRFDISCAAAVCRIMRTSSAWRRIPSCAWPRSTTAGSRYRSPGARSPCVYCATPKLSWKSVLRAFPSGRCNAGPIASQ